MSTWYAGRDLDDEERARFRAISNESRLAKRRAAQGLGPEPVHEINVPALRPEDLMPRQASNGLVALSLFSGGGGLDLGFDLAGFEHAASVEILSAAGQTLRSNRPGWKVLSGPQDGDVRAVDWREWRGQVDVIHGGPPCQPFSVAGRQLGSDDERDMLPEFVRAVKGVQPTAWVAENVPAIASRKFAPHINATLIGPLSRSYRIVRFELDAQSFGLPQVRRRVFFVGVRKSSRALTPPAATHTPHGAPDDGGVELPRTMGVRQALGLPAIGFDGPAPTLRSTLTGPRHTTSVLSSASAQKRWARLGIWPNGVAADREHARAFVARDGHFRMSVDDCAVIQGFPADWRFHGPVYMALGQLGNSVAPPVGYAVARAVARSLS